MSAATVFKRLEKERQGHSLTTVVKNRLLRHVCRWGAAVTVVLWISLVALSIGSAAGLAQERSTAAQDPGTGSLNGQVKAMTGQGQTDVLSGIEVTLSGAPLGASRSTVTDEDGHFQFMQLPAGTYSLGASPEGFRPWVTTVTLGQGQAALQDVFADQFFCSGDGSAWRCLRYLDGEHRDERGS